MSYSSVYTLWRTDRRGKPMERHLGVADIHRGCDHALCGVKETYSHPIHVTPTDVWPELPLCEKCAEIAGWIGYGIEIALEGIITATQEGSSTLHFIQQLRKEKKKRVRRR